MDPPGPIENPHRQQDVEQGINRRIARALKERQELGAKTVHDDAEARWAPVKAIVERLGPNAPYSVIAKEARKLYPDVKLTPSAVSKIRKSLGYVRSRK
jgi:hypothetical protein